jgi:hypothetical protein
LSVVLAQLISSHQVRTTDNTAIGRLLAGHAAACPGVALATALAEAANAPAVGRQMSAAIMKQLQDALARCGYL